MKKNQDRADQFWQEIISNSRKFGKGKIKKLDHVINKFSFDGPLLQEQNIYGFKTAVSNRIAFEKKKNKFSMVIAVVLTLVLLIFLSVDLLLNNGFGVMKVVGISTKTPTATPTAIPTLTPTATPTIIPTVTVTPSPTVIPSNYTVIDTIELTRKLPLAYDFSWIIPAEDADCSDNNKLCSYKMDRIFDSGADYALFYLDKNPFSRNIQFEVNFQGSDQISMPIIGSQIIRTSKDAQDPDWIFTGLYRFDTPGIMQVNLKAYNTITPSDLLIVQITSTDQTLLNQLINNDFSDENYSLHNVVEIYGIDDSEDGDLQENDLCLGRECLSGSKVTLSNSGEHQSGNYRLLVHLPGEIDLMPTIFVNGVESEIILDIVDGTPGWYISKEFKTTATGIITITIGSTTNQQIIIDSIFLLWKNPVLN